MNTNWTYFFLLLLNLYLLVGGSSAAESMLSTELVDKLEGMKQRALNWLSSERRGDYGWGSDTSRVVIALAAAVDGWPQKNDLEAMLIAKQLEIELLAKLLRYPEEVIPPAQIAYYALGLNAICRDPRDYYGYNIIDILEKHSDEFDSSGYPETFGFSLSSLVSCLGGSHIHRRQIHHLIQISRDETRLHSLETRSMALMALKCVHQHRRIEGIHRILHEGYEGLGGLQGLDGTFGNIHTTALVIQGLRLDENFAEYWNETSGIWGLGAMQKEIGSFEDKVVGTADALLAISTLLNGSSGILRLRRHHCSTYSYKPLESIVIGPEIPVILTTPGTKASTPENSTSSDNATPKGPTPSKSSSVSVTPVTGSSISSESPGEVRRMSGVAPPAKTLPSSLTVSVKYSLWIGPDPPIADKHNLTILVPTNTSFFHVMQRAAELDPAFEFSSTVWPNGHYVHTISGHREQPVGYYYWLLYRLPTDPDPTKPPPTTYVAERGVDDLLVKDGDIYLFWFKKI